MGKPFTEEEVQLCIELRKQGLGLCTIANKIGRSPSGIRQKLPPELLPDNPCACSVSKKEIEYRTAEIRRKKQTELEAIMKPLMDSKPWWI